MVVNHLFSPRPLHDELLLRAETQSETQSSSCCPQFTMAASVILSNSLTH